MSQALNSAATSIEVIFDEEDFLKEKSSENDDDDETIFEEYRKLNEKCDIVISKMKKRKTPKKS